MTAEGDAELDHDHVRPGSEAPDLGDPELEELLYSVTGERREPVRRKPTVFDRVLAVLAAVPVAAIGLLASMAVRVRLNDGVWPVRNDPDPKELGFHNAVTTLFIVGSFVVVVLLPILAMVGYVTGNRRLSIKPLLIGVIAFVALFIILRADLGGLGRWIAD